MIPYNTFYSVYGIRYTVFHMIDIGIYHEVVLNDKKDELGIVVIDEIHLVGDGHRGFLLELICTKLLLAATDLSANPSPKMSPKSSSVSSMKQATRTQIVGMSATVPNLEQMGQWLNAIVFRIDFENTWALISYN